MDSGTIIGWTMFGGFLLAWVFFAGYGFKKGWSKTISLGGGFIAGCFGLMAVAIPFIPGQSANAPQVSAIKVAAPVSTMTFDTASVASYFAAGSAMIYCDQLSDAQAKKIGDTVRYMGQQGGISKKDLQSTVYMAGSIVAEDLKASGGCSGDHFKEYERNYYEYVGNPAIAHLQGDTRSVATVHEPQLSPMDQIINALESSPNALCRNFAVTLRNTHPYSADSILRSAEKYGCL